MLYLSPARRSRGAILLIAIVLVVVVLGLSGAYLAIAGAMSERVHEATTREAARSAAEAGIDHARVYLLGLVDPANWTDPVDGWDAVLATAGGVPDWSAAPVPGVDATYSVRVLDNDDGDGSLVNDADRTVILESKGRSGDQEWGIRVLVTVEVDDRTMGFAIVTGGDLLLYGNQATRGALGAVHANEDLEVRGSVEVARRATASGAATAVGGAYTTEGVVAGPLYDNQRLVPIPPVEPAAYRPYADRVLTRAGQVRDGRTGLVLFDFRSARRGASYDGLSWSGAAGWSTVSTGPWTDGMYYVEGDFSANHGGTRARPWRVTIVAEGSISTAGSPVLAPYFRGAELFVAGVDVLMRGTGAGASIEGLILAHEQVDLDGNIAYRGRIVAESALNTPGSAVDDRANPLGTRLGGSVEVTYDGDLARSLTTSYRLPVKSWQEELVVNMR